MSEQLPHDPRQLEQSGATDESLLVAHEKQLGPKPDDGGNHLVMPIALLLFFSGVVFAAATYLNKYSGHYHADIFNETASPVAAGAAPVKLDPVAFGKKSYEQVCITCHMPTGQGVAGMFPPLAGSEWVTGSPERLIRIVVYGLKGPLQVAGKEYGQAAMPVIGKVAGSGYNWNDERVAAVLTYIRQEWGNKAGPITAEQVTAIRTKEGDRKEWSQEELLKIP